MALAPALGVSFSPFQGCAFWPFPHDQSVHRNAAPALEMETSRDQDGNCSKEGKTRKHLFLRQPQNESQIPDCRNATFTSHKQRCPVYLPFPSLRLLSMAEVQEEEEFWSYTSTTFQGGCRWSWEDRPRFPSQGKGLAPTHFCPNIFGLSCRW